MLIEGLKRNSSLTLLDLYGKELRFSKDGHDVKNMVSSANEIGDEGAATIGELLRENNSLTSLILTSNITIVTNRKTETKRYMG